MECGNLQDLTSGDFIDAALQFVAILSSSGVAFFIATQANARADRTEADNLDRSAQSYRGAVLLEFAEIHEEAQSLLTIIETAETTVNSPPNPVNLLAYFQNENSQAPLASRFGAHEILEFTPLAVGLLDLELLTRMKKVKSLLSTVKQNLDSGFIGSCSTDEIALWLFTCKLDLKNLHAASAQ